MGEAQCGDARCQQLAGSSWEHIRTHECAACKSERLSKTRVASGSDDPRFSDPALPFIGAPLIVPNNDIKYHTNKTRARTLAADTQRLIVLVQAKDTPTSDVLKSQPCDAAAKAKWLTRHDRESGDLYGMFLLIKGMPVVLTDHIDRNPGKTLLRCSLGCIHSWVLREGDASAYEGDSRVLQMLPAVVMVKFDDARWTMAPLGE